MAPLLVVNDLVKGEILRGISFEMACGEMLAVMGPSGSGKSTLLYNVAGMDTPDGGQVWLNGAEVTSLGEKEKARLRLEQMGFVFQQMNMLANLNLEDNIMYPAWHKGGSRKELRQKAYSLMEKLSIGELGKRKITEVSGGQLQRACLCRSLMNDPVILFADEPTGALNQAAAKEVMGELVRVHEEGRSVLVVTHDPKVASLCGRILYLVDGQVKAQLYMDPPESSRLDKVNGWLKEMGW